jgi:acyl-CoA synthetase (AMP-forming)/AMP-acid ligase II
MKGQRIEIISPTGEFLPAGERGEVVISGPVLMRGYLGRPEATAETIVDGWLRTGDVGILDEDGYLRIVGRIKDMIIRGGENIYPKEIESVLTAVDGVLDAAVVGRPDEVLVEVPVAYVQAYPGAALDLETLVAHCRRNLAKVKVPESITIVDELPKNPVGKPDKPALRRLAVDALTATAAT